MTYIELRQKHQKQVDDIPMFFAFSDGQLKEGMEKLGVTKDEILSIGGGGFLKKEDKPAFDELFTSMEDERAAAMLDDAFLTDAIRYELANHEYCITYDESDALDALGIELDDDRKRECFKAARTEYLENCDY